MSTGSVSKENSFGDALVLAAFRYPGGLKGAVDRIQKALGEFAGTRNTYAKFLRMESVDDVARRDRFRAWLLITTFGGEPLDWGFGVECIPPVYDPQRLRDVLGTPPDEWAPWGSNPQPAD